MPPWLESCFEKSERMGREAGELRNGCCIVVVCQGRLYGACTEYVCMMVLRRGVMQRIHSRMKCTGHSPASHLTLTNWKLRAARARRPRQLAPQAPVSAVGSSARQNRATRRASMRSFAVNKEGTIQRRRPAPRRRTTCAATSPSSTPCFAHISAGVGGWAVEPSRHKSRVLALAASCSRAPSVFARPPPTFVLHTSVHSTVFTSYITALQQHIPPASICPPPNHRRLLRVTFMHEAH